MQCTFSDGDEGSVAERGAKKTRALISCHIGSFSMQRRQWDLEVDFAVLRRAISVWSKLSHGRIRLSMHRSITNSEVTGAKNINSHRLREFEVKK